MQSCKGTTGILFRNGIIRPWKPLSTSFIRTIHSTGSSLQAISADADPNVQHPTNSANPCLPSAALNKMHELYESCLKQDVMLLTYNHNVHVSPSYLHAPPPPPKPVRLPPMRSRGKAWYSPQKVQTYSPIPSEDPLIPSPPVPVPSSEALPRIPRLVGIDVQILQVKESIANKYILVGAFMALQSITHQKPSTLFSKKDNALLGLRRGMPVGCAVHLEGDNMYHFLEKLTEMVLPRLKEYHGLKAAAGDGYGNFNMYIPASAMALFPDIEVCFEKFPQMMGIHINIRTSTGCDKQGRVLLSGFQIPFEAKKKQVGKEKSV